MKCPRCDVDLRQTDYGEVGFVVLDVCPQCQGMWFDEGELDTLDDSVSTNAELMEYEPAESEGRDLTCPGCAGKKLEALSPPGARQIVIDRCAECHGFWLDEGELDHVRSELLAADSAANKDVEIFTRPADWSWSRWMFYKLVKAYGDDMKAVGESGRMPHRA